jgi:hypothetical protein
MSLPVLSNLFVYCVGVPQKWSADFVGECRVFQWCEQIKRIMGNCILFMYSAQLWYTYKDYCVSCVLCWIFQREQNVPEVETVPDLTRHRGD